MPNKLTVWEEINGQSVAIAEVSIRRCRTTPEQFICQEAGILPGIRDIKL